MRFWKHPAMGGIDLVRARYRRHEFARHSHDTFIIGLIEMGVEDLGFGPGPVVGTPGDLILINPGEVHAGRAAEPGEWGYRALYLASEVVEAIGDELGIRGLPVFQERIVDDAASSRAVLDAHRAAEAGDVAESGASLETALARLLRRYCGPGRPGRAAGRRQVEAAVTILADRIADPPALEELAALAGTGKFCPVARVPQRARSAAVQISHAVARLAGAYLARGRDGPGGRGGRRGLRRPSAHVAALPAHRRHVTRCIPQ